MHVRDIIRAIAVDDLRETERGFRALVGYPREEEIGGATPETLMAALEACCDALAADQNRMPRETRDLFELSRSQTYADAIASIRTDRDLWEGYFARVCRRAAA